MDKQRKAVGHAVRRVRLIGWHGFGASGDDLLALCVRQALVDAAHELALSVEFVDHNKADLLVVGGGTLLGYDSMNIYRLVKGTQAPLVFFGGGFRRASRNLSQEHQERFAELMDRAVLKGVRGHISQQLFVHYGIADVEVIGDPALLFNPMSAEPLPGRFNIGVVVRSMGKTGECQYVSNEEMYDIVAQVCDFLVARYRASLYFFELTANQHDSDVEGAEQTIARMKYVDAVQKRVPMHGNAAVDFEQIGQVDYLVSQRLHPTITAWLNCKPCVAFDYQFLKTADFMNSIGMDEFVIRTDEFHLDVYASKFKRLMDERELIVEHSQRSIRSWQERLRGFARRTIALIH